MRCRHGSRTASRPHSPGGSGPRPRARPSPRRRAAPPAPPAPPPARPPGSPAPDARPSHGPPRRARRPSVEPPPERSPPRQAARRSPPGACGGRSGARRRWPGGPARCAPARPGRPRGPPERRCGRQPPRWSPRGWRGSPSWPRRRWPRPRCGPGWGCAAERPQALVPPGLGPRGRGRPCRGPGGRRRRRGLRPSLVAQSTVAAPAQPARPGGLSTFPRYNRPGQSCKKPPAGAGVPIA